MEKFSHCPIGSLTVGDKSIDLCAKRGCKLEKDFIDQSTNGGTDINGENVGPYWTYETWNSLTERTADLAGPEGCLVGEHVLYTIQDVTVKKLMSEPPQIRQNFTPLK